MSWWIPKEELIKDRYYICKARNFDVGLWNGQEFEYLREKFGMKFPDTEDHWDDGAPFGTVKPIQLWEAKDDSQEVH
jgi:hypothetical protein